MTVGEKAMYAIAGIAVLAVLVMVLDVGCMMALDMRLVEVPQRAMAIVAGMGAFQPKPVAAQALVDAAPTPRRSEAIPIPRPSEATPTPISLASLPTNTPQPTAARPTETPSPQRPLYRVVDALAGDTIEVSRAGKTYVICYAGVDAPDPVTMIGCMATQANRLFVKAKTVYLEGDASESDQSGCLLRHVFLEDGTLVSAKLAYFGYATVRSDSPNARYRDVLLQMQQWAKEGKRGLWDLMPMSVAVAPAPVRATPTPKPVEATPTLTPVVTNTPTPTSTPTLTPTLTNAATATFTPTQPPPAAVCDCSRNIYNCEDFPTPVDAQDCYNYCKSLGYGDVHDLDRDNDGIACKE